MLRNLSFIIFTISYISGYFRFIPNYIILLIIFAWLFDATSFYFINSNIADKNPYINKVVTSYLGYNKPLENNRPILFFLDRFIVPIIFIFIFIYYFYLHGFCYTNH